jgi:hypothetical protein
MPNTLSKECISHEAGCDEAWVCLCGNDPTSDGFYPCDEKGNEIETGRDWNKLYVCARCGRIIQQDSLEIVGQNPQPRLLA